MGTAIVITAVVVVALVIVGIFVVARRARTTGATPVAEPASPKQHPDPTPMTGLEEALNKATDRSGHTMADRLDAETEHVASLREPDDTGPLLRRALDSVDQAGDNPGRGTPEATADDPDPGPRPG